MLSPTYDTACEASEGMHNEYDYPYKSSSCIFDTAIPTSSLIQLFVTVLLFIPP